MNPVGEPDAGNPHVRFDERVGETGRSRPVSPETAPNAALAAGRPGAIQDQYIVVFKAGASPRAAAAAVGATPRHVYHAALNGFAARLNAAQLAALRNNPHMDFISPDQVVAAAGTRWYPTWGLDRIDQRYRPLDYSYTYGRTGAGVNPPPPPGSTPLSVSAYCDGSGGVLRSQRVRRQRHRLQLYLERCRRVPRAGGYSWASIYCYYTSMNSVSVTVTDSNGATATGSSSYYCGGGGGGDRAIP